VGIFVWLAIATAGARLTQQAESIGRSVPALTEQLQSGNAATTFGSQAGLSPDVQNRIRLWLKRNQARVSAFIAAAGQYAMHAAAIAFWAIVIPILSIWVLRDKHRWMRWLSQIPDDPVEKRRVRDTLAEINGAMRRYIWAQLLLSVFAFAAYAIFLSLIDLKYAIVIAAVAGLLELIFVFGPLATAIIVLGVALFSGQHHWLAIVVFLIGWRVVQDYVNTPLLFGERLDMHPLWVVLVLVLGWEIAGVIGMFLAVPIAAAVQITWCAWSKYGHPGKDLKSLFEAPRAA
jgi:predicted PurR-regulated permease PerM